MRISVGAVLDPYDDGFASLGSFFQGRAVPSFIKTAAIMDETQLHTLPDHAFAVVLVGEHEQMRKYACTNKAHTTVNVLYFLDHQDEIPPTARVKTASNLSKACRHFGIQPPVALLKTAANRKRLIKTDGAEITVPVNPTARLEKESDLSGTRVMPKSARPGRGDVTKQASVMDSPYVRLVDEWVPERRGGMTKTAAFDDGRLPLNTYDEVDSAVTFFQEMAGEMHPRVRHEMCTKLASRADQLGVPVSPVIRKYGSTEYASSGEMQATLSTRRQVWAETDNEEGPGLLDLLMEKRASLHPERFAEALAELDARTQIDHHWDNGVCDPWLTTFGEKRASAKWSWQQGDESLTEGQLKKLAAEGHELLKEKFGADMAKGLADNPVVIFDSLPMDTQRIIASMASR